MGMNEQEANEAIAAAMREIEELRRTGKLDEDRKADAMVYAEVLAGRSLQGREELQRREADAATVKRCVIDSIRNRSRSGL